MLRRCLRIPATVTVAMLSSACDRPSATDAATDAPDVILVDTANDLTSPDVAMDTADVVATDAPPDVQPDVLDVVVADAVDDPPPDCAFTCMNEFFPGPDGSIVHQVFFADGAISYDAACDAPPPDPRCGV